MNPLSAFAIALAALGGNKLRSALTMLGIVIGVSAVITLMAAGQGAQTGITERIRGLGSNLLFIRPGPSEGGGAGAVSASASGTVLTLVDTDAYAIDDPERFPYVESVAPQIDFEAQLIYRSGNVRTTFIGTTPSYQFARNFYAAEGRFLTEDDVIRKGLVAVLGANVADSLFGDSDPLGRSVRLSAGPGGLVNFRFRVVGVMERKGATATADEDDLVFLPLPTMQARIPFLRHPQGLSNVFQISVRVSDSKYFDQATEEIGALLRDRHGGEDDFVIRSQEDLISTVSEVSDTLTILLGSIAGISLVVGGIGIMNIMLVSVTERTREIGIRKAVGARRSDVLMQFLVEALVVTMVGGALGVLLGVGAAQAADGQMIGGQEINTVVTPFSVIVAFSVSAAVGLFFGIYPAFTASRLNPIEALRHE